MPVSKEINGAGVAISALGLVIAWAGVRNVPVLDAFRDLAMGRPPTPRNRKFEPVAGAFGAALADTTLQLGKDMASGSAVLAAAEKYAGRGYRFGGGHGDGCGGLLDCSGFVSCALKDAGLLQGGPLDTWGLAKWGRKVDFAQRAPGDVLVWLGGPGGGHTGIVVDQKRMVHTNCASCGGVRIGTYGPTRTGRPTLVRRAVT